MCLLFLAVVMRFYGLGDRVISHDESLHTYYSWELSEGRGFQHTPLMHGPFQFHALALSYFLFGDNDFTSRIPAAVFGVGAIGLLWWFRDWLGRVGAFGAAVLMTISPTLLYYSRYARNEAFAVVFALLMVLAIRRYYQYGGQRWLYLLAVAMALSHTTKEVAFIYDAIFMLYLGGLFVRDNLRSSWRREGLKRAFSLILIFAGMAYVVAISGWIYATDSGSGLAIDQANIRISLATSAVFASGVGLALVLTALAISVFEDRKRVFSYASFDLLLLMGTLVLPQLVAFPVRVALNLDPLDYTAAGMWRTGPILIGLILLTGVCGFAWNRKIWLGCAGLFYSVYIFFFTTMFSNSAGLATGMVGSLGYWLEQQGVARGGQPWYYYMLIQIPMYEYLPAIGAVSAGILILKGMVWRDSGPDKRDYAARPYSGGKKLLGYWTVVSVLIYSIAGEKMPWLTVHLALPMVLASGWVLQRWFNNLSGKNFDRNSSAIISMFLVVGLVAIIEVISRLNGGEVPFQGTSEVELEASMGFVSALLVLLGSVAVLVSRGRRLGLEKFAHLSGVVLCGAACLMTVRTSVAANFLRYDQQTEFINYASGAPGIRVVMEQVEEISSRLTDGLGIRVAYDDDVSWPFTWYLRHYRNQVFFGGEPRRENFRDTPLVIAGDNNWSKVETFLDEKYLSYEYIRMWWPMQDYFGLRLDRAVDNIRDSEKRSSLWDIWYRRDYTHYGELTGVDFSLSNWPVVDRMRFYVKKDVAAQLWDFGTVPEVVSEHGDNVINANVEQIRASLRQWGFEGVEPGQFRQPRDVAVGPGGYIYVADTFNHRIQKFSHDGRFVGEWGEFGIVDAGELGLGMLNEPWGIAVDADGFVYVADTWNHRVQKFTDDGDAIGTWGLFGNGLELENMWGPREVAIGPNGDVYVADTGNKRISVFSAGGLPIRQIGSGGFLEGQFDEPVGVAVREDGEVYVADAWNRRVQVFDAGGEYIRQWESVGWQGESLDNKPYLVVDAMGRVISSDPEGYQVIVWDEYGELLEIWGQYGADGSNFDLPTGIALDGEGGLYVMDSGNSRIMYFLLDD